MINFVQLQYDLYDTLLSSAQLSAVNIVLYRKWRLEKELQKAALWQTPRNGASGAGILVEMPTFTVDHPNLPGPDREVTLSVLVVEEPNLNLTPKVGTLLSAEEIADLIQDELHALVIEGLGGLYAGRDAIKAAEDVPDLIAYRLNFSLRAARNQTARCAPPQLVSVPGLSTLSCATPGASIYYTQDGGYPGACNPAAVLYAAPFVPAPNSPTLRYRAYAPGLLGSTICNAINPNYVPNS